MNCSNCGNGVHEKAIACPKCGVPPRLEKKFCFNCGSKIQANRARCFQCGVSLPSTVPLKKVGEIYVVKIKAVLLGFLTTLGLLFLLGLVTLLWPAPWAGLIYVGLGIIFAWIGGGVAGHKAKRSGGLCGGIVGTLTVLAGFVWLAVFDGAFIDAIFNSKMPLMDMIGPILCILLMISNGYKGGFAVENDFQDTNQPPYDRARRSPTRPGTIAEFRKRRLRQWIAYLLMLPIAILLIATANKQALPGLWGDFSLAEMNAVAPNPFKSALNMNNQCQCARIVMAGRHNHVVFHS